MADAQARGNPKTSWGKFLLYAIISHHDWTHNPRQPTYIQKYRT